MAFSRSSSPQRGPPSSTSTTAPLKANRQLRELLNRKKSEVPGSKQSATDSKETYVCPNVLPQNVVQKWPGFKRITQGFNSVWLRLPGGTRLLPLILLLLFTLLFAGCADLPRDVPSILECNVPPELLDPTPQPPLNDETLDHLLQENEAVRNALTLANGDKARVKQYIQERCTTLPPV